MENYPMNRFGQRPYNRTCGMINSPCQKPGKCVDPLVCESSGRRMESSACEKEGHCADESICVNMSRNTNPSACADSCRMSKDDMYMHLKHLVPAMAYVPCQQFTSAYDLKYALGVGTIFPQLCKPFCGKRGARK